MNRLRLMIIGLLLALQLPFTRRFVTANTESSAGTHKVLTRLADAAHANTHLLVKQGSDSDHVAVCAAVDYPLGITDDQPEAAEDVLNVHALGVDPYTRKVRVGSALGANIDLYTAAGGLAQAEPAVAGVYHKVGRSTKAAVQVGAGDYIIEFIPCYPVRTNVVAAFAAIANVNAAMASPGVLKVLP